MCVSREMSIENLVFGQGKGAPFPVQHQITGISSIWICFRDGEGFPGCRLSVFKDSLFFAGHLHWGAR